MKIALKNLGCLTCALLFLLPFVAAGGVGLGSGGSSLVDSWKWMRASVPATALVEERHHHGGSEDEYEATVVFSPVEGEEVSARVVGTGLKPGSTVHIRYDPDKPRSARLQSWEQRWGDPAAYVVGGAVLLAVSVPLTVVATVAAWRRQLWPPDEVPRLRQDLSLAASESVTSVSPPQQAWSNDHGLLDAPARRISVSRSRQGRP